MLTQFRGEIDVLLRFESDFMTMFGSSKKTLVILMDRVFFILY